MKINKKIQINKKHVFVVMCLLFLAGNAVAKENNNLGTAGIKPSFSLKMTTSFVPEAGQSSAQAFSRSSTATFADFENTLLSAKINEARFERAYNAREYAKNGSVWKLLGTSYNTSTCLLKENSSNNWHLGGVGSITAKSNRGRGVFIVQLKASERTWARIQFGGYVFINLADGGFGTVVNTRIYGARSLGDGWYEIIISPSCTASSANVIIVAANGGSAYQGDNKSGILVKNPRMVNFREGKLPVHKLSTSSMLYTSDSYSKYRGGVALGDSFSVGYVVGNYSIRVNSKSTHLVLAPEGVGGETLTRIMSRFDKNATAYHPSFMILSGGRVVKTGKILFAMHFDTND